VGTSRVAKTGMRSCKKQTPRFYPYGQTIVTVTGMQIREAESTNLLRITQV
jgi:hypothetical protein